MKKILLAFAALTFIAGMALTGCSNSAQNASANNSTKDTIIKGDVDSLVYISDIETYKKQTNDSIAANQKSIDEFNTRIANEKEEDREEYKEKITELNRKNSDLKRRLDEYKADGKAKWIAFKTGVDTDMHKLGRSITELKNKIVK
jgi:hypothetical protein